MKQQNIIIIGATSCIGKAEREKLFSSRLEPPNGSVGGSKRIEKRHFTDSNMQR